MRPLRALVGYLALVAVTMGMSAAAQSNRSPIDHRAFLQSIQGSYRIVEAGGKAPKPENSSAEVTWDAVESYLTLPYCIGGDLCDAGFVFLPHPGTEITREVVAGGTVRYTFNVLQGNKMEKYRWEESKGSITFRNFQYVLSDGSIIELVHVLERVNRDEE